MIFKVFIGGLLICILMLIVLSKKDAIKNAKTTPAEHEVHMLHFKQGEETVHKIRTYVCIEGVKYWKWTEANSMGSPAGFAAPAFDLKTSRVIPCTFGE